MDSSNRIVAGHGPRSAILLGLSRVEVSRPPWSVQIDAAHKLAATSLVMCEAEGGLALAIERPALVAASSRVGNLGSAPVLGSISVLAPGFASTSFSNRPHRRRHTRVGVECEHANGSGSGATADGEPARRVACELDPSVKTDFI